MKNNKSDNEKFLKNLIERKSRDQLMDDYKSIKGSSAAYNLALPVLIILAAFFLPATIDDRWPIFLIAAVVAITFTADLVAINKKWIFFLRWSWRENRHPARMPTMNY